MDIQKFIFSEKRPDRLRRHVIFWVIWYLYFAQSHAANPFGGPEISYFKNPVYTFTEAFFLLLPQLPVTYCILYLILPRYILKKKYLEAIISIFILWILSGALHVYLFSNVFPEVLSALLPADLLPKTQRSASVTFFMAILSSNKGTFTVAAFALVLKFSKHWYLKEQRNLQLQKENAEAQLQLLTAQVHPHFLFNTLNNIFSKTQTESPDGSKMIMSLSDMLRYILYEGPKPSVPLKQELAMIKEYINLEKIRYGNKLDVHVLTPDNTDDLFIAPLLLLPFIENCFKHGTSTMLQNPWINLTVEVKNETVVMKLMNGKAANTNDIEHKPGIGIRNVKQRLELLYPERYELLVREEDEVFVVDLKLRLNKIATPKNTVEIISREAISA